MTTFRLFLPLAAALLAASTLIACNTAPSLSMGSASAQGMGMPGQMDKSRAIDMSKMDAQMKKMREMHEKMAAAKTPEERNRLMADHMKTMQDSMQMMGGMSNPAMSDMKDMPAHHSMMDKRMAMMESMMQMMMDRMPTPPVR